MRSPTRLIERIEIGKYDVIILNYANCDMVGHTGVFERCKGRCGSGGHLRRHA